jgi:16S rRNA G966 N2-methylase RsmD
MFTQLEKAFIQANLTADVGTLLLRGQSAELPIKKLAAQIVARQKAREKLPTWYANPDLMFPPALSVEQASSEQTAQYKASLVNGHLLIDLTGGMGVDTVAFSQRMEQVVYVERQSELAELAAHNLPLLGAKPVRIVPGDGMTFLDNESAWKQLTGAPDAIVDWLYLDPHRRNEQGGKVVLLTDCEPDLTHPDTISKLLNRSRKILLKTSPLLDIDSTVRQLAGAVESVHIVAVQGEVKEILFTLVNQTVMQESIKFNAVNLTNSGPIILSFQRHEERTAEVVFGDPQQYVYEPNATILKAGAFRLVADRFGLKKLAPNSHLYTSSMLQREFPGRIFELQNLIKPDAKALKTILPDLKANLTVRNFPQTVAELRKKLNLREGGNAYILATTLLNGDKRLLVTRKVDPLSV